MNYVWFRLMWDRNLDMDALIQNLTEVQKEIKVEELLEEAHRLIAAKLSKKRQKSKRH